MFYVCSVIFPRSMIINYNSAYVSVCNKQENLSFIHIRVVLYTFVWFYTHSCGLYTHVHGLYTHARGFSPTVQYVYLSFDENRYGSVFFFLVWF